MQRTLAADERRRERHPPPVIPAGAFAFGYGGPRRRESRTGPLDHVLNCNISRLARSSGEAPCRAIVVRRNSRRVG